MKCSNTKNILKYYLNIFEGIFSSVYITIMYRIQRKKDKITLHLIFFDIIYTCILKKEGLVYERKTNDTIKWC